MQNFLHPMCGLPRCLDIGHSVPWPPITSYIYSSSFVWGGHVAPWESVISLVAILTFNYRQCQTGIKSNELLLALIFISSWKAHLSLKTLASLLYFPNNLIVAGVIITFINWSTCPNSCMLCESYKKSEFWVSLVLAF